MDRRLLFPAIAMTAAAQTVSPATQRAEKALRARAEQFYRLELAKSFRQAEALVADDSKDYFYNSGKPNFKGVKIENIEFTDKNTRAIVHLNVSVELLAPGIGAQVFSAPSTSNWKLEKGQWVWYFDKESSMATPFGKMKFGDPKPGGGSIMDLAGKTSGTSPESLGSLLSVDRRTVALTAEAPDQTVTISNGLPGPITLSLGGEPIDGITAELEKKDVKAGEKAVLHVRRSTNSRSSGTLTLTALPLGTEFYIVVTTE